MGIIFFGGRFGGKQIIQTNRTLYSCGVQAGVLFRFRAPYKSRVCERKLGKPLFVSGPQLLDWSAIHLVGETFFPFLLRMYCSVITTVGTDLSHRAPPTVLADPFSVGPSACDYAYRDYKASIDCGKHAKRVRVVQAPYSVTGCDRV